MKALSKRLLTAISIALAATVGGVSSASAQEQQQPNILVIWGDDVGFWNVGAYSRGMMGYQTPNIDRIAKEGALFTDVYAQRSCTAGRAAFSSGRIRFALVS
jgi:arylsulfatase A-like enzyme